MLLLWKLPNRRDHSLQRHSTVSTEEIESNNKWKYNPKIIWRTTFWTSDPGQFLARHNLISTLILISNLIYNSASQPDFWHWRGFFNKCMCSVSPSWWYKTAVVSHNAYKCDDIFGLRAWTNLLFCTIYVNRHLLFVRLELHHLASFFMEKMTPSFLRHRKLKHRKIEKLPRSTQECIPCTTKKRSTSKLCSQQIGHYATGTQREFNLNGIIVVL